MTPADLEALAFVMRKHRVLKCGEVELHSSAFAPQSVEPVTYQPTPLIPTNEEFLFASSGFPLTKEEIESRPPEEKP